MKKVAIISRHAISNYGSFFQAIALEKAIRNLGYESCTINYINKEEKSYRLAKIDISNSKWNKDILHKIIFYAIDIPNRMIQFIKFNRFRKKELNLTKEFNNINEIDDKLINADIYCTGSDQVWNETINNKLDLAYFYDFLDKEKLIFSYAASFGKGEIKKDNVKIVKKLLNKYRFISVREDKGVEILKDLNIKSEQVLDPTFLLNSSEWRSIMGAVKPKKEKYIFIYQIHKNPEMIKYAKNYAKKFGYKIYNISVSFTDKKCGIKLKYLPSYKKVLSLFDNAHCIITDSFHATAFSINLNKNFVTFLPKQSTSRNNSILELFGLKSRSITDAEDYKTPETEIDYNKVNKILENERNKSYKWLKDVLKELSNYEK